MSDIVRRLPVYLVLDTSGSMAGEPIEAVRQGVRALISDLRSKPQALENVFLSVITFNSTAQQLVPLTELLAFQEPNLDATGATSLGAAIKLLRNCLNNEIRKATPEQKGDYKPLVFLMTDGQPTDNWEPEVESLRNQKPRPADIIACAAGPLADVTPLKKLTEKVVKLHSLAPDELGQYFQWLTQSIDGKSRKPEDKPADEGAFELPPPPGVVVVP